MAEQQKLIYTIDGEPYVGTLHSYANALKNGFYTGVEISDGVWIVEYGHMRFIEPTEQASQGDDYLIRELTLPNGESARYRVDLRG